MKDRSGNGHPEIAVQLIDLRTNVVLRETQLPKCVIDTLNYAYGLNAVDKKYVELSKAYINPPKYHAFM